MIRSEVMVVMFINDFDLDRWSILTKLVGSAVKEALEISKP